MSRSQKNMCPIMAIGGGARNLDNSCLFPPKETFTILSTICVPLNCIKARSFGNKGGAQNEKENVRNPSNGTP